jgi:predicted nucleotidyltransferase
MRLRPAEVTAIKAAAADIFGASAVVRLFGSRTDDTERGGDIDLHVEADPPINEWDARYDFEQRLFRDMEPQKVDLIISVRGGTPRGFERIAYRDGIVL